MGRAAIARAPPGRKQIPDVGQASSLSRIARRDGLEACPTSQYRNSAPKLNVWVLKSLARRRRTSPPVNASGPRRTLFQ